jgi:isocitrate dehydrogenase (NAD+)
MRIRGGFDHEAAWSRIVSGNDYPPGKGDVGGPNRILREEIGAEVILRTGRRIPGVRPIAGVYTPISVVRMAVDDAYGAKE